MCPTSTSLIRWQNIIYGLQVSSHLTISVKGEYKCRRWWQLVVCDVRDANAIFSTAASQLHRVGQRNRTVFKVYNSCIWWHRKVINIGLINTFSSLLGIRLVFPMSPYLNLNILCISLENHTTLKIPINDVCKYVVWRTTIYTLLSKLMIKG